MNLRFTKLKFVFSLIIPIALWIIVLNVNFINPPKIIQNFLDLHDLNNLLSGGNIVLFLIEAIIAYLLLSLIHRRKQHWNQPIRPLHTQ